MTPFQTPGQQAQVAAQQAQMAQMAGQQAARASRQAALARLTRRRRQTRQRAGWQTMRSWSPSEQSGRPPSMIGNRGVDDDRGTVVSAVQARHSLTVVGGQAQSWVGASGPIIIGRAADAGLSLGDPMVSMHHARVDIEDSRAVLSDLGSTNGTFVNGSRISGATELFDADRISVGSTEIRYSSVVQPQSSEKAPAGSLYGAAMEARAKGDPHTAQRLLREALSNDPADARARRALGFMSLELGDTAEALETLYSLLVSSPSDVELLTGYGSALSASGRYNDAEKILSRAAEIEKTPRVQIALAEAKRLAQAGSLPSAVPLSSPAAVRRMPAASPVAPNSGPRVLADDLDTRSADTPSSEMRGAWQVTWHRRATSYRRLWAGMLFVLIGILAKFARPFHDANGNLTSSGREFSLGLACVALLGLVLFVSAIIAGRFTSYTIYEHRIDIKRGILSQRKDPIWLYDISGIEMRRTPLLTLTGTASIEIEEDDKDARKSTNRIVAAGNLNRMTLYMERLQGDVVRERRAMKKMWI